MKNDKYAIFDALNPFFETIQEGLTGLVDGKHFSTRLRRMRFSISVTTFLVGL